MINIQGEYDPQFAPVAEAFECIFHKNAEVGASIGVYFRGKPVVDLWGGMADPDLQRPWERRTVTPIASTGKSLAAVCALMLVERGQLDLDAPVADYWPEFAAAGKDRILVRWLLAHRSGVAALDRPISNDDAMALTPVLKAIEVQKPWWEPGTRHGYHGMTFGFLVSGLIQHITGLTVGQFFAQEVARPLQLDLYIGLDQSEWDRVAHMIGPSQSEAIRSMINPAWFRFWLALLNPRSVSYHAIIGGTSVSFNDQDELRRYDVEDASAGVLGNGISLARLYAALIGNVDGIRLIGPDLIDQARRPESSGTDEVLRFRSDWGLGFMLPGGTMWPDIGVPGLFGHTGASGSLAFADPENELAFGFTPSRWSEFSGWLKAPKYRFESLMATAYRSIGIPTRAG